MLAAGCCWCWGATGRAPGWQEASRYRLALKRMAGDLLSLRRHVTSLEVENGHLRHRLAGHEEPGGALLADLDVDVMTREEVLDRLGAWSGRAEKGTPLCGGPRCPLVASRKLRMWPGALAATLRGELVAGAMEMRRLKDRVQQLQNELIRVPAPAGTHGDGDGVGALVPATPSMAWRPLGFFFPFFPHRKMTRRRSWCCSSEPTGSSKPPSGGARSRRPGRRAWRRR